MKTFLMRPLTLFSLFISGLAIMAISFYTFSFALDVDPGQGIDDMDDPVVLGNLRQDVIAPACLDNYEDLPHSGEYTPNNDWSLKFFPFEFWNREANRRGVPIPYFDSPDPRREQFIDVNGDGFVDYFYTFHKANVDGGGDIDSREIQECVYLNSGHGWDLAYRCYGIIDVEDNTGTFYGDCAVIDE
ncbi:hypothetical protein K9M41_03830 [Candidatus Gracilibacteria bacterium]|nr:hypothetical protein [Candidatus Gracilibacteria bacterium]